MSNGSVLGIIHNSNSNLSLSQNLRIRVLGDSSNVLSMEKMCLMAGNTACVKISVKLQHKDCYIHKIILFLMGGNQSF